MYFKEKDIGKETVFKNYKMRLDYTWKVGTFSALYSRDRRTRTSSSNTPIPPDWRWLGNWDNACIRIPTQGPIWTNSGPGVQGWLGPRNSVLFVMIFPAFRRQWSIKFVKWRIDVHDSQLLCSCPFKTNIYKMHIYFSFWGRNTRTT